MGTQRSQRKPDDTMIHELRLVVRVIQSSASDIPIRSWFCGSLGTSGGFRCRHAPLKHNTPQPVPWTLDLT